MKLTAFYVKGETHVGVVLPDGGIIDATAAGVSGDLRAVIAFWEHYRPQLVRLWRDDSLEKLDSADITFAPMGGPTAKLICIGLNYADHVAETQGKIEAPKPEHPIVFSKFSDSLAAHRQEIWLPTHMESTFDYEAELVAVIGKAGSEIPEESALTHVFGYTCGNDLTIREAQRRSGQWLIGKSYPHFAPVGPTIVTADAVDAENLDIKCLRGGEVVQHSNTRHMLFKLPEIISYVSRYIPLRPGDLIFTGTPSGVILGAPGGGQNWLKPGETVTVAIENIGELSNTLIG